MKNNKKRNLLLSLILAAVCIVFLLYVDKFQHYSMLASVFHFLRFCGLNDEA